MGKAKVRWNRCTNGYKEDEEELLTSEEEEYIRGLEAKARAVFDSDEELWQWETGDQFTVKEI